ncbi:MAG: transcriptional regulator TrmB, partial [Patescibacteria group bacterium]
MSFITKGRRRVYNAESPERLRDALREKERSLEGVLPELLSLLNTGGVRPRVRFYEGTRGVKTVFEDTLTVKDKKLLGILSMADLYVAPGKEFMDDYVKRRVGADINLRVIRSETKEVEETWKTSIGESREARYAPEKMIFPMTVYIYDGKAAIMGTEREQFGMIIESPDFYRTLKNLFEVLWRA